MRKKIGNAVKRNRIKRKIKIYCAKVVADERYNKFRLYICNNGKDKAYKEYNNSLYEKMKKSFKRMQSLKV